MKKRRMFRYFPSFSNDENREPNNYYFQYKGRELYGSHDFFYARKVSFIEETLRYNFYYFRTVEYGVYRFIYSIPKELFINDSETPLLKVGERCLSQDERDVFHFNKTIKNIWTEIENIKMKDVEDFLGLGSTIPRKDLARKQDYKETDFLDEIETFSDFVVMKTVLKSIRETSSSQEMKSVFKEITKDKDLNKYMERALISRIENLILEEEGSQFSKETNEIGKEEESTPLSKNRDISTLKEEGDSTLPFVKKTEKTMSNNREEINKIDKKAKNLYSNGETETSELNKKAKNSYYNSEKNIQVNKKKKDIKEEEERLELIGKQKKIRKEKTETLNTESEKGVTLGKEENFSLEKTSSSTVSVNKEEQKNIGKSSNKTLGTEEREKQFIKSSSIEKEELEQETDTYNIVKSDKGKETYRDEPKNFQELNKTSSSQIETKEEEKVDFEKTEKEVSPKESALDLQVSREEKEQIKIKKKIEKRLEIHKRLWFVRNLDGEIDPKILPNTDYNYPIKIDTILFDFDINKNYFKHRLKEDMSNYKIELYDEDCKLLGEDFYDLDEELLEGRFTSLEIERGEVTVATGVEDLSYIIVRFGNEVLYQATEKFLADNHPIPFGSDLGLKEIPMQIYTMVEFINMVLLFWSKYHSAFSGWTGTQAINGLLKMIYHWLTLESSVQDNENMEDYERCYRWLRWEAEKIYQRAKGDLELHGNLWIELMIGELIDYMETHHFNSFPYQEIVVKMDEVRNLNEDPSLDIDLILDKFKGARHRVLRDKREVIE